ncbi:MAG: 4Fe-4S dicluster domain-containing protein [Desulfuromonadales bacterium]
MGHLISGKAHLVPLIDRLNRYPVGLVDNQTLREILALLFSEEEASLAARFPLAEATADELSLLTGITVDELLPKLEQMADKGLVVDTPCGDTTYWMLMPGLIGFFEFTFMKKRTDLPMAEVARLMHEYLHEVRPGQAEEFFGSRTQLTRALTYEDKVPVTSNITSWEDARQIVREAEFGAAGTCFCRHQKEHLDQTCRKQAPVEEICIALGTGARFLVRRGFMAEKSTDELLAILDTARSYNLTHVTDNIREKPSFICNCCACCCELMAGIQMGFADGVAKTPFLVDLDRESCNLCGKCVKACNVAGIEPVRESQAVRIDETLCLGCGACLDVCPQGALQLVERNKRPKPPRTKGLMFARILKEKKRLMPVVKAEVTKNLKHLIK